MDKNVHKGHRYLDDYTTVPSLEVLYSNRMAYESNFRAGIDKMDVGVWAHTHPHITPDIIEIIERANNRFNSFIVESDRKYYKLLIEFKKKGWA